MSAFGAKLPRQQLARSGHLHDNNSEVECIIKRNTQRFDLGKAEWPSRTI